MAIWRVNRAVLFLLLGLFVASSGDGGSSSGDGQAAIDWVLKNGGYVHPALEYRDGGMFATAGIGNDTVLASVPKALAFPLNNR